LWLSYVIISIAMTRVVVEGGLLFVQPGWTPLGSVAQIFNSGPGTWLPPATLVPAALVQANMITDYRTSLLPSFVQSFKLAHDRSIKTRPLLALIAAVTCIAFGMSVWMNVRIGYDNGGLTLHPGFTKFAPELTPSDVTSMIEGARDATWTNSVWIVVGIVITYAITLARSRFLWFPLHPIGFVMCLTYPMHNFWLSIFFGWLCKVLITHFGGNAAHRKLTPFFLGLAVGDIFMMLFWDVVDTMLGYTGHQLMPG
jgi:hypothetical protein